MCDWASVSLEQSRASVAGEGGGLEPCSVCTVASPRDRSEGSSESVIDWQVKMECFIYVYIYAIVE